MKYKNIPAVIHNIGHSFMSAMNYVDGACVHCEVRQIARSIPGELEIDLISGAILPAGRYSKRVQSSVEYYRVWLQRALQAESVDPERVAEVRLRVRAAPSKRIETFVHATDDRGRKYAVDVLPTK